MDLTRVPCRRPGYQLEVIDDEVLLFNPAKERILYCNQTAFLIWQLCDGKRTGNEIVDILVGAFPEAVAAIPGDVKAALEELHKYRAIGFQ